MANLTYQVHIEKRDTPPERPQIYRASVEIFKPGGGGFMVEALGHVGQAIEGAARKCRRYGINSDAVRFELERAYIKLGEAE